MSVITRLAVETELIDRVGGLLSFVGKSATATGANPNLTGAIAFACQLMDATPTTPGDVTDTDLQAVDPGRFFALCDLAEYRLIKSCLGNFTLTNEAAQDRRQDWATLRAQFAAQMDALGKQYAALLNPRQAPTRVGSGKLHFPVPNTQHWGLGRGRYDH